jgi:hypothetical protein
MEDPKKMKLNEKQIESFNESSKPLIKWLNENCHPHVTIIVTTTDSELSEGICVFRTEEFLKD